MTIVGRHKVVLLGEYGVGKTSLVRRFVSNTFSEEYISTLGVRVEKNSVELPKGVAELMVWDVAGIEPGVQAQQRHLRGAHAAILVLDISRASSIAAAQHWLSLLDAPNVHVQAWLNKADLQPSPAFESRLAFAALPEIRLRVSAKTGVGVPDAFRDLARRLNE